jgi:hypothetical protein
MGVSSVITEEKVTVTESVGMVSADTSIAASAVEVPLSSSILTDSTRILTSILLQHAVVNVNM